MKRFLFGLLFVGILGYFAFFKSPTREEESDFESSETELSKSEPATLDPRVMKNSASPSTATPPITNDLDPAFEESEESAAGSTTVGSEDEAESSPPPDSTTEEAPRSRGGAWRALREAQKEACESSELEWKLSSLSPNDFAVATIPGAVPVHTIETTVPRIQDFGEYFTCRPALPNLAKDQALRLRIEMAAEGLQLEGRLQFRLLDKDGNVLTTARRPIPAGSFDWRSFRIDLPVHPATVRYIYSVRLFGGGKLSLRKDAVTAGRARGQD
jgi:hypothetical protein